MHFTIEQGMSHLFKVKKKWQNKNESLPVRLGLNWLVVLLWVITTVLLPLVPPAQAAEPAWVFMSADVDGDGLPSEVESAGWCNAKGCFTTNPLDPDSDDDGLTDGEEKLFDSIPSGSEGPGSPGIYVVYDNALKTKEYYPWQPYGHKLIARADSFIPPRPDVRDAARGKTDLDAVVVRRGTTFTVGGPIGQTLQIVKSTSSLTTLTPVKNPLTGEWQVTVPSNGTVGKYTLKLGSESMDLFVIFQIPTPSGELTQAGIERFLYDDDPNNTRDLAAISLGDINYPETPPPPALPYGDQLNETYYVNEGSPYTFATEHYSRFMLEDQVMKAINGVTTQRSAADALTSRVDALTVFRNPRALYSSWNVLNPGSNVRQQCSNIAALLTGFNRAAGIVARPVMVDWSTSSFDHSTEIWLDNTWMVYRGYARFEMNSFPDDTRTGCSGGWPQCGSIKYRTRSSWGTSGDYRPSHSGGGGGGSVIVVGDDNWVSTGLAYRWGSWSRTTIRLNPDKLKTKFSIYWRSYGWTKEPTNLGLPGWPPPPPSSLTTLGVMTQEDMDAGVQASPVQLGEVVNEYGVDTNGNGQYDQLVLEVQVTAAQAGRYWLRAQLSANQFDPSLIGEGGVLAEALVNPDLAAGTQIVPLVFSGLEIGPKRVDGPYRLSGLWLTDVTEPGPSDFMNQSLAYRTNMHLTAAYKATEFETYGAVLSNQYTHVEVDSDGDGRTDSLTISTGLDVYRPGNYTVEGVLVDAQNEFIGVAHWQGAGGAVQLTFDGVAGRVGPYQLKELRALNEAGQSVDEINQAYLIQPSQTLAAPALASFDLATSVGDLTALGATITPTQVFNTQVVNGNLQLDAQVNVGQAGSYKLEAWLADGDGNLVTWAQGQATSLGPGVKTLSATFKGSNIRARGIAGPYQVVALKILDGQTNYQVLDKVDVATTTPAYDLESFTQSNKVLFADFVEQGNTGWSADAPWTIVEDQNLYFSPSPAWIAADADGSLRLNSAVNLTSVSNAGLKFHTGYNFAPGSAGYVEVSTDGGANWNTAATFTGNRQWSGEVEVVGLKAYSGKGKPPLLIRFRLAAAGGGQWSLDDILISAIPDRDGDGISNEDESQYGTDPNDPDTDNDGLLDGWEIANNLNPLDPTGVNGGSGDPDNDNLSNYYEQLYGTDPHNPDSDGDGLPDGWEVRYDFNPLDPTGEHGATGNPDNDGLNNLQEYQRGTHPRKADTDGDGIPDHIDDRNEFRIVLPSIFK